MIVVDTSAVIAIFFQESLAAQLSERLKQDADRVISAASYIEAGAVMAGRQLEDPLAAIQDLDDFLAEAGIEVVPVDAAQAREALRARIVHGRGLGHGGVLNFGDSFSYALAKLHDAPLLFCGNDFSTTDVRIALSDTI